MVVTVMSTVTGTPSAARAPRRLVGLDAARGLALLGMLLVNFDLVVSGRSEGHWALTGLLEGLRGRAAATFVVLAGVGASLGARSSGRGGAARTARRLRRRGLLLFVGGTALLTVWPADILHFYGVWLALGSLLLRAPDGALWAAAGAAAAGGAAFLMTGRFLERWDLETLEYRGLFEPLPFLRNLALDGFHPVLPWFAFYAFGMWLGRRDLGESGTRARLAVGAAAACAAALAVQAAVGAPDGLGYVATTACFPPTPVFVVFGAAVACLVIVGCVAVGEAAPRALAAFGAVGRLALTHYVAHVLLGLGALEAAGRLGGESREFAAGAAIAYFALAMAASLGWRRTGWPGPLERLLRTLDPQAGPDGGRAEEARAAPPRRP